MAVGLIELVSGDLPQQKPERNLVIKERIIMPMSNDNQNFSTLKQKYNVARNILGKDFMSSEEIEEARGVAYTKEQHVRFIDTLPDQDTLLWCRDKGCMVAAGPNQPMSFLEVCKLKSEYLKLNAEEWYEDEPFALNDKVDTRWLMLGKEPFLESTGKNWTEQKGLLLPVGAVVPNVTKVVWGVTTYRAVRGESLFSNVYVRTSSVDLDKGHVDVGSVDGKSLYFYRWDDGSRSRDIGVAYEKECT